MIPIILEPIDGSDLEVCCLCRRPTHFWTVDQSLALCPRCASHAEQQDLPTKSEWMRKEEIIAQGNQQVTTIETLLGLLPPEVPCVGAHHKATKCPICLGTERVPKAALTPFLLDLLGKPIL